MQEKNLDKIGRQVAINLDVLMAQVDFQYNRHNRCLVCNEKYKHHEDGIPCLSDATPKRIIRTDRWGNTRYR